MEIVSPAGGTPTRGGTYTFDVRAAGPAGTTRTISTLVVSPKDTATRSDLRLDLSAPSSAAKETTFSYRLITKNTGPATARPVNWWVVLPATVRFVSATGTYTRSGNIVTFERSSLAVGQTVAETITVEATTVGTGTAKASTFSTRTPDTSVSTNSDTVATTVR